MSGGGGRGRGGEDDYPLQAHIPRELLRQLVENHVTCPVYRYSEMSGEAELVTMGGGEEEDAEVSGTNLE